MAQGSKQPLTEELSHLKGKKQRSALGVSQELFGAIFMSVGLALALWCSRSVMQALSPLGSKSLLVLTPGQSPGDMSSWTEERVSLERGCLWIVEQKKSAGERRGKVPLLPKSGPSDRGNRLAAQVYRGKSRSLLEFTFQVTEESSMETVLLAGQSREQMDAWLEKIRKGGTAAPQSRRRSSSSLSAQQHAQAAVRGSSLVGGERRHSSSAGGGGGGTTSNNTQQQDTTSPATPPSSPSISQVHPLLRPSAKARGGSWRPVKFPEGISSATLKDVLEQHGIDTTRYGKGESEPIGSLLAELKRVESVLWEVDSASGKDSRPPQLLRVVRMLRVELYAECEQPRVGKTSKCVVEVQSVTSDGRVRDLSDQQPNLISTSMNPVEHFLIPLKRVLETKLDIDLEWQGDNTRVSNHGELGLSEPKQGKEFPGLPTQESTYLVRVKVVDPLELGPSVLGLPEGKDFEVMESKTNRGHFFSWFPIDELTFEIMESPMIPNASSPTDSGQRPMTPQPGAEDAGGF